jgi:transcriptional regulator with XRE-family HTH domain
LARRAGTSAKQVRRIEQGEISPSVATLGRLMAAMGERLVLDVEQAPIGNETDAALQRDYRELTAAQRVAQAARLSRALTSIAAAPKTSKR